MYWICLIYNDNDNGWFHSNLGVSDKTNTNTASDSIKFPFGLLSDLDLKRVFNPFWPLFLTSKEPSLM